MIIKPRYNIEILEEPFNKGTLIGIIVGVGVCNIIVSIATISTRGIMIGFTIFMIGILQWFMNYRKS